MNEKLKPVYLAGPIESCTDKENYGWRIFAQRFLDRPVIIPDVVKEESDDYMNSIIIPDKKLILSSRVVLANCWKISAGTSMEILFAWEKKIPVITIGDHLISINPWISGHSTHVMKDLSYACTFINEEYSDE